MAPDAMEALARYEWKGNVRELRNTIERALILSERPEIAVSDLPEEIRTNERSIVPEAGACRTLREFKETAERAFLVHKLRENGWNISLTATKIDTPRSNLYKKIEAYKIDEKVDG